MLSSSAAWVLADRQILWTATGGNSWEDITPPISPNDAIDNVFFLDETHGWAFLSDGTGLLGTTLSTATTTDRGKTWSSTAVAADDAMLRGGYGAAASLSFSDPLHGWALIRHASSSASSIGSLYTSTDGGKSWTTLPAPPVAGDIRFTSALDGWLAGGVGGRELYLTHDGGEHWILQTVDPPNNLAGPGTRAAYDLPSFENSLTGTMPVTFESVERHSVIATYSTVDGGGTWKLRHLFYNAPRFSVASSHGKAVAVLHRKGSITLFGDLTTRSAAPLPNLPDSASTRDVQFVDNSYGWLLVSGGECAPTKLDCVTHTSLLKTEDGGQTLTAPSRALQGISRILSTGEPHQGTEVSTEQWRR